jgi:pyruvate formate lyase activating enzyme
MTSGMIFDLKRYAIHDGPGIRTSIFMKGCPLSCWWCHNPEGQLRKPQLIYRANRCKKSQACVDACPKGAISWADGPVTDWEVCDQCGKCAEVCFAGAYEIVGRAIEIEPLMAEITRDIPFYDQSNGGVTFTGGEPLLQMGFLRQALLRCKQQDIHTAVDTSGYTSWANLKSLLPLVDLFLFDLKHMDAEKHKQYMGVGNQRILSNLQNLSKEGAAIIVRIPLIPEVNDDAQNMMLSAAYLASLPHLQGVELMPYHEIGVAKYQALGMKYRMLAAHPPTIERIKEIENLFSNYGLPVIVNPSGRAI